ncbi:polyhydroxybutyrate depolymerase [Alteromonas sp. ASW11-19]|uniref:Polyhydroxybutyrate depolymerase n=1 Tax=Alteromonas salexigens TaxID=2982530 RepID=A0ABT2VTY1_9ALTE|nr:PHB depolymerase family esterase [Alteromonas salexigens]MCU7555314.1 polyhydroxybutyrate depolymerase [Alteromonas salexigens]
MNMTLPKLFTLSAGLSLAVTAAVNAKDQPVPPLNLDTSQITVSGLSSGGYMANQMHIAYSDWVKGAGIIAAGPYYCGQNDITTALSQCVNKMDSPVDLPALSAQMQDWAKAGKVAALDNLKDSKVWLLHGTADARIISEVSDLLHEQYQSLLTADNLTYVNDKPFAHLFPTLENGGSCTTSEAPFIGNCEYDAAGNMLQFIAGDLQQPDDNLSGKVYAFNQHQLAGDHAKTLADNGFVYVPKSCEDGENCEVHVSFHGCNQYADAVDDAYITGTGLNRWADDNHMVVVYPQTRKSLFMPLNPQGCWDWWGYTSDDYATRDGHQLQAVKAIVEGLDTQESTQ